MGVLVGADVTLLAGKLDEHSDAIRQALRDLRCPRTDPRTLVAAADPNPASGPIVLDLGAPASLAWAVQQVVCAQQGALTAIAVANVVAAVFRGKLTPGSVPDLAQLVSQPQTIPFLYPAGRKQLICRPGEHLYVVAQGAGTNAASLVATASVIEIPATAEAYAWL